VIKIEHEVLELGLPVKRALDASEVDCESYFASMRDEMVIMSFFNKGKWVVMAYFNVLARFYLQY